jgi:hypothetical protein
MLRNSRNTCDQSQAGTFEAVLVQPLLAPLVPRMRWLVWTRYRSALPSLAAGARPARRRRSVKTPYVDPVERTFCKYGHHE